MKNNFNYLLIKIIWLEMIIWRNVIYLKMQILIFILKYCWTFYPRLD